ncbi:hypothetical protein [uncultured Croceitalea sp.]|uniref:hypothetical protein n=1 Tax=uncultured Croceitalea sp. TaxID=1798908 RepID=UPI00374E6DDF
MIKLIWKIMVYAFLIFLVLEALVRIFHLQNDTPTWYLDEDNVYKWVPGQEGYAVYGNRRQQFSKYHINESGYNSYTEFEPTRENIEVAILGDSFIEGFHQDYFNSIGKKIENVYPGIKVYEYGHSSFDLADQLYLHHVKKEKFSKIDLIIFEVKYKNDLQRNEYTVPPRQVVFPLLRHSKLLVYLLNIGMVDPIKQLLRDFNIGQTPLAERKGLIKDDKLYQENFKSLISKYDFDKSKMTLLLDSRETNISFLDYLEREQIQYIDYGAQFANNIKRNTTLIYDRHWNDYGRSLVAKSICDFLKEKKKIGLNLPIKK